MPVEDFKQLGIDLRLLLECLGGNWRAATTASAAAKAAKAATTATTASSGWRAAK